MAKAKKKNSLTHPSRNSKDCHMLSQYRALLCPLSPVAVVRVLSSTAPVRERRPWWRPLANPIETALSKRSGTGGKHPAAPLNKYLSMHMNPASRTSGRLGEIKEPAVEVYISLRDARLETRINQSIKEEKTSSD